MHKLLLWATYAMSALASFDNLQRHKRTQDNSCTQQLDPGPDEAVVVQVNVGAANGTALKYFPEDGPQMNSLPPGTIVQFNFMPKNHTVTESSFAEPCKPLAANLTSITRPGIRTGFVPVTGNEDFTPAFRIRINDTKPIWIYCGQVGHCQKGMVMVINQNQTDTNKTLANYRAAAANVPLPAGASNGTSPLTVSPASTSSSPTNAPGTSLAASGTAAATAPLVSVFSSRTAPTTKPVRLAAVAGLFAICATAIL